MAGSTVLVVDDEPRIVDFLVENLSADDFSVLTASNGEQALDVPGVRAPPTAASPVTAAVILVAA